MKARLRNIISPAVKEGLAMTHEKDKDGHCCPRFDPAPWDDRTHEWKNKPFIKRTMPQLFHVPFPPLFASRVSRMWQQAREAGAAPELKDFLLMATDPSPWKSELYMAVTGEVPGADNVVLSGTFFTRVFDGPYGAVPKWIKEMDAQIVGRDRKAKRYFLYFTTCPKCARAYGQNYAVAFAQLES